MTEAGFWKVLDLTASATFHSQLIFTCLGHLYRYNSGWNGNDAVTENHDQGGQELPNGCSRGNITVSNGSKCDYGPINTSRNAVKAMFSSFHHEHEGAQNDCQRYHSGQKHKDLFLACLHGSNKHFGSFQVADQFQNSENTE